MHSSYHRLAIALAALAGPAIATKVLAQDQPLPPPPPSPMPVPTPPPAEGDSKLDLKTDESWGGFFKGWKGGVEIGLSGSEGNSENFNMHAGANAQRKNDHYDTKVSFLYLRSSTDGTVTKNRAELDLGNDWILEKGSPWRYFVKGSAEYDDFQDWQYRLTAFTGVGYAFIETDNTTLIGRAGVGVRDDLLGSDNRIHPEGLLGVDWSHKFSERQRITTTAEFYPDFLDLNEYRYKIKAEWELIVDPETKLSIKIGAEDRFSSNPGPNTKKNDLDYYALLVWSF
jgi:putative salt-induced outer membrane protein YdiY